MKKSINLNNLEVGTTIKLTEGASSDLQMFSKYGIRLRKDGLWDVVSFTFDSEEGKVLKTRPDKDGYPRIDLISDMGKQRTLFLHRIVGLTLLPQEKDKVFINHIDEDKENFRINNLEWCTHQENMSHGERNSAISISKSIPVVQLDLEGNFIKEWKSATECGTKTDFNKDSIGKCCSGKSKTHKGFKWMKKEDYELILKD